MAVDTRQSKMQLDSIDISGSANITRGQHLLAYIFLGKTVQLIAYDLLSVFCECNGVGAARIRARLINVIKVFHR